MEVLIDLRLGLLLMLWLTLCILADDGFWAGLDCGMDVPDDRTLSIASSCGSFNAFLAFSSLSSGTTAS
jgi:hypothetical protein